MGPPAVLDLPTVWAPLLDDLYLGARSPAGKAGASRAPGRGNAYAGPRAGGNADVSVIVFDFNRPTSYTGPVFGRRARGSPLSTAS
jgi:hypothetical protein